MPKTINRVAITSRDEALFRYLFVNKVATVADIGKDIFKEISLKTIHRRLVKLSNAKLIIARGQREHGNRMVYSLTKQGFAKYVGEISSIKRVQLKSDSIDHDLALLEIKRAFKELKQVKGFYGENIIRSGILDDLKEIKRLKELHSDAIVKLEMNSTTWFLPLEYEANSKFSKRNEKLVRKYYTSPFIPAVLFISKDGKIEKRIQQKEKRKSTQGNYKFYYLDLESVTKGNQQLKFNNLAGEELTIR